MKIIFIIFFIPFFYAITCPTLAQGQEINLPDGLIIANKQTLYNLTQIIDK